MADLTGMMVFYHVVTQGTITKAAERLDVSNSFVSKRLARLEAELATKLLVRTTRQLQLTQAGAQLLPFCQTIVQEAENAQNVMLEQKGKPSGILKLSVPPAWGRYVLRDKIITFIKAHPEITLQVHFSERQVDVIKEGYDLVIRSPTPSDANLVARKVIDVPDVICATPKYLAEHGTPQVPYDLNNHNCLGYSKNSRGLHWTLISKDQQYNLNLSSNLYSNDFEMIKAAALDHQGILKISKFMVEQELASAHLVPVLPNNMPSASALYAIYPDRKYVPLSVRAFLDLLIGQSGQV